MLDQLRELILASTEPVTVASFARSLGFSESGLRRLLRGDCHVSLYRFVTEIQVEKACGLLLDSEMTVGDIAYRCGFSSQSAFNRRFRTETGETPLGYRTKIRQSPDIAYHGLETR